MKTKIFTLIFAVVFSSVAFSAEAALQPEATTSAMVFNKIGETATSNDRRKKRKLKKKVRQVGRVYRVVKTDRQDKKKSRKVQRKIRRIINVW